MTEVRVIKCILEMTIPITKARYAIKWTTEEIYESLAGLHLALYQVFLSLFEWVNKIMSPDGGVTSVCPCCAR